MSSYKITNTSLNPKRVFILQKSEMDKRLDPQFYKEEYKEILSKIKTKDFKRLGEIVKFSSESWNQKDFFVDTFPYIEISEINTISGEIENLNEIEIETAPSRAKMIVRENDIIISTTRPSRGAISLIKKEQDFSIASTGFCVARTILDSEINRNYLFIVLRQQLILKQLEQRSSGGNYPAITQEELSNVVIPKLESEKQEEVISIFNKTLKEKQKNEEEAEKLIASIDNYLLKELGITLPVQEENTLKSRMFTTSIKELSSSRFDPYYHTVYFKQIDKNLHKSQYNLLKLKSICNLQNGYAFKSNDYSLDETNTLNIRMSNIRPNNNFDADYNIRYLPDNYSETFKEYLLNDGDIVIAMTDMAADPKILGVPTIVKNSNNRNLLLNQRVGKLFDFDFSKIEINYLKEILGSAIVKAFYNKMGARGVQINISSEQILSAFIPVPPLEKQIEIANHISKIRQQAQELKNKTKLALQQANQEIENLLLN